ncbi:ATP synthase subunit a [Azospirillaceae bacterium]
MPVCRLGAIGWRRRAEKDEHQRKRSTLDPLHQFHITPIIPLVIGGVDVNFNNAALAMVLACVLISALLIVGTRKRALVPGRLQSLAEILYDFVSNIVRENAGEEARPFFPLVFTIFTFVLFGNMLGMVPYMFTFTSHLIVTFTLAFMVFLFVTVLGFVRHGLHFFAFFMPPGAPIALAPVLVPIEIISYFIRPVSLSVRLFANMMAGHTMLKVFAGFSVMMVASMGGVGYFVAMAPVAINVALVGFELMVAFVQAYVFALLSCLYIRDAIEMH